VLGLQEREREREKERERERSSGGEKGLKGGVLLDLVDRVQLLG
jgi:hypothetical protein